MFSILGLPDEGRDALMSAALDPPDGALESWRRWERSGADARTDPVARRWLPLIGHNLRDAPVDTRERALFVEARRHAWASNLRLLDAAHPALESLAAAGIRTMLLKGAVLVNPPYGEPGLRPIGDVDVLVEPVHARAATHILEELGWVAWRGYSERDLLLAHGLDLWKPPHGALDVHWYLLAECCWAGADLGVWRRALPMRSVTSTTFVPAPADLLLHICVHGLRWSPVHAGHWVADAVRIIQTSGARLDWDIVTNEAGRRRLGLQMMHALRVVRERGHVDVPQAVIDALEQQPVSWRDRLECRFKGRPVVSLGGLFVIWTAWRRSAAAARTDGKQPPSWTRFLAAALGVATPAALVGRFAAHAWTRARGVFHRAPSRGASTRTRMVAPR
jgi:Uncharacterised nucleotidyltransferase